MINPVRAPQQTLRWAAMGAGSLPLLPFALFADEFQARIRFCKGLLAVIPSWIRVSDVWFVANRTSWLGRRQGFDRKHLINRNLCQMATTNWMRFPWVLVSSWWLSRWWLSLLLISAEFSERTFVLNTPQPPIWADCGEIDWGPVMLGRLSKCINFTKATVVSDPRWMRWWISCRWISWNLFQAATIFLASPQHQKRDVHAEGRLHRWTRSCSIYT